MHANICLYGRIFNNSRTPGYFYKTSISAIEFVSRQPNTVDSFRSFELASQCMGYWEFVCKNEFVFCRHPRSILMQWRRVQPERRRRHGGSGSIFVARSRCHETGWLVWWWWLWGGREGSWPDGWVGVGLVGLGWVIGQSWGAGLDDGTNTGIFCKHCERFGVKNVRCVGKKIGGLWGKRLLR